MYQVVLVDDDRLVTKFLEKMIPWEKCGFEVIASFQDSLKAYEYLASQSYDVLITDIGMPHMNGIELISNIKEIQKSNYHVILSCHDEFDFAQQALKLGAYDYLLKETMEEEDIIELLGRLKKTLDETKNSRHHEDKLRNFLKANNMPLKSEFLEKVINESYVKRDEWWQEQEELLEMNFSHESYTVALCYIDQFQDAITHYENELLLQYSINNILEEVLIKYQEDVHIFYLQEKFFILFPAKNTKTIEMQNVVESALKEVQRKLSSFLKLSLTMVINIGNQKRDELAETMQILIINDEQRFYYPHGSIQYFHPIEYNQEYIFNVFSDDVDTLKRVILNKDYKQLKQYINDKINTICKEKFAPRVVKDWAIKLMLDIKVSLNAFHHFDDQTFNTVTNQLLEVENFQEIAIMLETISLQFIEKVSSIESTSQNEAIFKAQKYVLSHLDQKISLKDVSEFLHFNTSYFSRMYKKETGESFIEYVTRVKMEKAQELLENTTKSVEQISIELGFDSKSYFLKTFKKNTGLSPQEYKYNRYQD